MTGFAMAGAFVAALRFTLALVPAAIALPVPAAAEVTARASDHGTYGRMVFDWRAPVRHTARLSGRSLTIRFGRPITGSLIAIRRNLSAYVDEIAVSDDARAITVALTGRFRMRSFVRGNRVVVDLVKVARAARPGPARPSDASPATASGGENLPVVAVRTGRHQGFGRLVFDWPEATGYAIAREGAVLTVTFDRRARIDLRRLRRALPRQVNAAAVREAAGGLEVMLMVAADARLRHFRRGDKVVLDIIADAQDGDPQSARAKAAAAADDEVPARVRPTPLTRRAVADIPPSKAAAKTKRADAPEPPTPEARESAPAPAAASDGTAGPVAAARAAGPSPHPEPDETTPATQDAPPAAQAQAAVRPAPSPAPAASEPKQSMPPPSTPDRLVSVEMERNGVEAIIRFNWRDRVAAAVFDRADTLWIVFDRQARLDLSQVRIAAKESFERVQQIPVPGASVVRILIKKKQRLTVRREGTIWAIDIGPAWTKKLNAITPRTVRIGQGGAQLHLAAKGAGRVISIRDPIVGDLVHVVPMKIDRQGVPVRRRFPDFELFTSAQGVAVRAIDEDIKVETARAGITISRPGGLKMAGKSTRAAKVEKLVRGKRLLDFTVWQRGGADQFQRVKHELTRAVAQARGERRDEMRLTLARFYLAREMSVEALSVLDALLGSRPKLIEKPGVRAMRGVAQFLIGRYAQAAADLEHPSLATNLEIYPWRAGIAAARGDWAGAYRRMEDTDPIFFGYPARLAVRFGLLGAEAAMSVDDYPSGAARLVALRKFPLSKSDLDYIAFLRGHLLKRKGENDAALALWHKVIETGDRRSRAKASFTVINVLLELGRINRAEAINRFEALRFAWRNDVFEFDLYRRLAQLYTETKDLRRALDALRRAVIQFNDIEGAEALTQEMTRLFKQFHLDGVADTLPPIAALSVYQEFRELMPPGKEGDNVIHKLVDRLVSADLLAEAADLLNYQIGFRAKGARKAAAGARLAEILLTDRNPARAIEALRNSRVPKTSERLAARRRLLEVRSLADLGKADEALKMLAKDDSADADKLRAAILWRSKRWPEAARVLARLTSGADADDLDEESAALLLRRAVALALDNDREGLDYLRDRFGDAMAKSKRAADFHAVVGKKPLKTEDFAALARRAGELDVFTAFLKRRIGGAGTAAVIN